MVRTGHSFGQIGMRLTFNRQYYQEALRSGCAGLWFPGVPQKDAVRLADGLWDAIRPHVKRLEIHAEGLGILHDGSNDYVDSIWLTQFDPATT
jgi:hypothetical protein